MADQGIDRTQALRLNRVASNAEAELAPASRVLTIGTGRRWQRKLEQQKSGIVAGGMRMEPGSIISMRREG